jgi:hypothetical protein
MSNTTSTTTTTPSDSEQDDTVNPTHVYLGGPYGTPFESE